MLNVNWPPVRNMFIPDPGWVWFDIDLAGADAQVVAWDAGDEDLKQAFRDKVKIHVKNGSDIWGKDVMFSKDAGGKTEPYYTRVKRGVHLTNYGGTVPTLARKCGMSNPEADKFQTTWLQILHPSIAEWHERKMFEMQTTGRTSNKFGYSIDWFDRPSMEIWRRSLAWTPQSTIAHVTEEAMIRLDEECERNAYFKKGFRFTMQVHDSLDFIVKLDLIPAIMPRVYTILHSIVIPYDDPLIIPWGIKRSRISWGECKDITWESVTNVEGSQGLADSLHGLYRGHGGTS